MADTIDLTETPDAVVDTDMGEAVGGATGTEEVEGGDSSSNNNSSSLMTSLATPRYERGAGRGGGGRGRGRGGGKVGNYRGRTQRRHTPYNKSNNNNNDSGGAEGDSEERGRRVYVGNLSWDVSWRDLKDHMKTTGCEVTRADVMTSGDGRSKGCGIVEFATVDGARRAVLTLNDTDLMGRQIFVREDREGGQPPSTSAVTSGSVSGSASGAGAATTGSGDAQSRRCYVGNLSWDVAWQDLKDHMREAGDVVYAEVMTEHDGRSKGCGIVEYATPEEAQEAISSLTDTDLKGRMIFVREDRETGGGGNTGGGGGGGAAGDSRASASVYVGNLAFETSWQDLKDHMRGAGNVDQANVLTGDDGRSKGCGIVLYQRPQDAARAIRELQNSVLHDRPIFVREDREQGNSGGGGGHHRGGASGGVGTQLFVGNLSYDTTWRELKDHFRQCGDVERAEVVEGQDGRKKGFGTVKFFKQKDANNAIRRLNGEELQGRSLEVRLDHKAK